MKLKESMVSRLLIPVHQLLLQGIFPYNLYNSVLLMDSDKVRYGSPPPSRPVLNSAGFFMF